MAVSSFDELKAHVGHHIVCVTYGSRRKIVNVALECEDCGVVLLDYDKPTKKRAARRKPLPSTEVSEKAIERFLADDCCLAPDHITITGERLVRLVWENYTAPQDGFTEWLARSLTPDVIVINTFTHWYVGMSEAIVQFGEALWKSLK